MNERRRPGRPRSRKPGEVSLERALSKLGIASRSEAHELIVAGRVAIDGAVLRNPGAAVVPERIRVDIDGQRVGRSQTLTIMLHKPGGYVTTRRDPEGRPTIYDLIEETPARVEAVGRLDMMTTGLLLCTNDTQFGDWLTDPANGVPRVYQVAVKGRVERSLLPRFLAGVVDRGERLSARRVELRRAGDDESKLLIELSEGKNREVRRLCAALGHETTALRRIALGALQLGSLASGRWRVLTKTELQNAFPAASLR